MEEMDLLFGLIGIAAGLYCIYSAYMMKKTGDINPTLLLDKQTMMKKCKDKKAYLTLVLPKVVVLGITSLIYGAVLLVNLYVVSIGNFMLVVIVLLLVVLVWYSLATTKAKKMYY